MVIRPTRWVDWLGPIYGLVVGGLAAVIAPGALVFSMAGVIASIAVVRLVLVQRRRLVVDGEVVTIVTGLRASRLIRRTCAVEFLNLEDLGRVMSPVLTGDDAAGRHTRRKLSALVFLDDRRWSDAQFASVNRSAAARYASLSEMVPCTPIVRWQRRSSA